MFELTVERRFSAAHSLRDYDGPCARLHGHNYRVEISVSNPELDDAGMIVDFTILKAACDEVLARYDHQCLNELPEFAERNVTAENLAVSIFQQLAAHLTQHAVRMSSVRLWETDGSSVTYRED
jgi:6-pyruvoyltetrahydropterin/6-carboxytetrahydropterin synthase